MTGNVRLRLSLWYAGHVGSAAFLAFIAAVLRDEAWPGWQLSLLLATFPVGVVLGGPFWSWVADRSGRAELVRLSCAVLQFVAGLVLATQTHPALLFPAMALFSVARAPLSPMADALTLHYLGVNQRAYGTIRAWGSVSYLIAAFAGAALRSVWPTAPLVFGAVLLATGVLFTALLPAAAVSPTRPPLRDVLYVALRPDIAALLLAATLQGVAQNTYDTLFTRHVESLGLPPWIAGAGIATGVGAEIVVLIIGRWILDRLGPVWPLAVGLLVAIPRSWLLGTVTSAWVLVPLQATHGLSFGALWIACVALIAERSPRHVPNSAQALLPAAMFGAGNLLAAGLAAAFLDSRGTPFLFQLGAGFSAVALVVVVLGLLIRSPRT